MFFLAKLLTCLYTNNKSRSYLSKLLFQALVKKYKNTFSKMKKVIKIKMLEKKCLVSLLISDTVLRAHCVFCRSALRGWLALHYLTRSEGRSRSSFLQCFSARLNRKRGLHTHFNRLTHMSCWDHPCLPHPPTSPLLSSAVLNEPLAPSPPLSSRPPSLSIQPG